MTRLTRFALFLSIGLTPLFIFQSKLLGQSSVTEVLSYDYLRKLFKESGDPAFLAEICEQAKFLNAIGRPYYSSERLTKIKKDILENTIPKLGVERLRATEYDKEILASRFTTVIMDVVRDFCPGIY